VVQSPVDILILAPVAFIFTIRGLEQDYFVRCHYTVKVMSSEFCHEMSLVFTDSLTVYNQCNAWIVFIVVIDHI